MSAPTILPRSEWTDTPGDAFGNVTPDRTITPSEVEWFAIHWPGDGGRNYNDLTKAQVAEKIRGYHRFHTESRGWADIGYPFIVDMAGRIWEGAGTKYAAAHSASTAYPMANQEGMAVLLLIGENERPSTAMVASVNDLQAHLRESFPNMAVTLGHQQVRGASTQCPGPHVMAVMADFTGQTSTTPPPKEPPVSRPTFVSPAQGRVSSEWGSRVHPITKRAGFHRGLDIANNRGTPIYAAYDMTIVEVYNGTGTFPGTGGWNTGRTVVGAGNGGGNELYGHLQRIDVRVGQKVRAGDQIGTMGDTGNVTGPHLHFETWDGRSQGGGANGRGQTRNPRVDFNRHGVTPGSAPSFTGSPTPPPSSGGGGGGGSKSGTAPNTGGLTLTADGVWGPATSRALQERLRRMNYRRHAVDGDFGPVSNRSLQSFLRNRGLRFHAVDGVFGPATARSLQRYLRNRGFTNSPVDGDFGRNAITALQLCLLAGKFTAVPKK